MHGLTVCTYNAHEIGLLVQVHLSYVTQVTLQVVIIKPKKQKHTSCTCKTVMYKNTTYAYSSCVCNKIVYTCVTLHVTLLYSEWAPDK